jgi:hypothetical protein
MIPAMPKIAAARRLRAHGPQSTGGSLSATHGFDSSDDHRGVAMYTRAAAVVLGLLVWSVPAARAQVVTNLHPGDLAYQFADPVTGLPITTLNIAGPTAKVAVYLKQVSGTPTNLFQQLGLEAVGVRLVYNGTVARVPNNSNTNINSNVAINSNFDLITKGGSTASPPSGNGANNTTDTSTNVALTEGIVNLPAPTFPGSEDPLGDVSRIYIGTFTLQATAPGTEQLTAVDPFNVGNQLLTGPNPPTDPADGFHGEIPLDQYLSQYAASPTIPTLTVNAVPEPGTLVLGGLTAMGLVAGRFRRARDRRAAVAA